MDSTAPSPTPGSIRWIAGDGTPAELSCPVCHERQRNVPLLEIPSMADGAMLALFACSSCDSKFFDPPEIRDFNEVLAGDSALLWKTYAEAIGGIWDTYWPAALSTPKPAASLLDVGCGFGFTIDAWRRVRGEAVGVELAEYGRIGSRLLDVPIHFAYLQDIPELRDRRFDVVLSSEVIEHVPDPQTFAQLLSRYVADDGVLCLTTPNAEFIRRENDSATLLAALSPGFHGFLIGPRALETILRACGFIEVIVRPERERLFAWASRTPLDIENRMPQVRAEYMRYLEEMLESRKENDIVSDGIAYRHFRDTVLAGRYDDARKSLARLETGLKEKYPADPLDPDQTPDRVRTLTRAEDYNSAYPWFLPTFYYVRGVLATLVERDDQSARRYFRASRELTRHITSSWGFIYALEALAFLPEAWRMETICAARLGDPSVCEEWMAAITESRGQESPAFGGGRLTDLQIEQAFLDGLAILSAFNRSEALGSALNNCLQYSASRYGDWLSPGSDRPRIAPGKMLAKEHQMLLVSNMATACARLDSHADLIKPLLERVLLLETLGAPSGLSVDIASKARERLSTLPPRKSEASN